MRKFLLSIALLTGVGFGFAKNGVQTVETGVMKKENLLNKQVQKFHFKTIEEAESFFKRCLMVIDIHYEDITVESGPGYISIEIDTVDTHIEIEYDC